MEYIIDRIGLEGVNRFKSFLKTFMSDEWGKVIINSEQGLCYNLFLAIENLGVNVSVYPLVSRMSVDWEHYSGVRHYPVPATEDGLTPDTQFSSQTFSKYEGSQLELRKSLAAHLLKKLEQI